MNLGNSYEYKKQCIFNIHHDDQIGDAFFNNVMITGIRLKRERLNKPAKRLLKSVKNLND